MELLYMQRCFDLARLGSGQVSPNPMVGAVLVYENRIIGEGYHKAYGQAHAEVNAVNNVLPADQHLIQKSTLYVSLEPCCIWGRTPPCTNLIIEKKIPKVVISVVDQTPEVSGQGLEILRSAGVQVTTAVLSKIGTELAQIRNTFAYQNRPYVLLKYAISQDEKLAPIPAKQVWLSNAYSKRLTHRWRMEHDAILVGTNTAMVDNPALSNRLYYGASPIRVVLDQQGKLPPSLKLFDGQQKTLVFIDHLYAEKKQSTSQIEYIAIDFSEDLVTKLLIELANRKITSLLVEGGQKTLESFLISNLWDEARVYQSQKYIGAGIDAPKLNRPISKSYKIDTDELLVYKNDPLV